MMRFAAAVAALTAVYALALGSLKLLDLLTGAIAGGALLLALRPFGGSSPRGPGALERALALPHFVAVVAWDVLTGAWHVALVILRLRPLGRSGIVAIPIGDRTPAGVAVTAYTMTLSPGEVLVDVDPDRGVFLVQVLDAGDPDGVRRRQASRYELQRRVVP